MWLYLAENLIKTKQILDDDEFLVVNLTRYPSYFLVDRMHPLLERRDELVLEDLYDFP